MAYTSDLTLVEYGILEPHLPRKLKSRPQICTKHQIAGFL
jgi:hypothetical protein